MIDGQQTDGNRIMECDDVRDKLELLVLDGLDDTDASHLRAHLARCDACATIERDYRQLLARVRRDHRAAAPRPPADGRAIRSAISASPRLRTLALITDRLS